MSHPMQSWNHRDTKRAILDFDGMTVDEYAEAAHTFLHEDQHPTLGRSFRDTGYLPTCGC